MTLSNFPSGDVANLGSDASPDGSIDYFDGAPSGAVSFTCPVQNPGVATATQWAVNGQLPDLNNPIGYDVYDLVIDGIVRATSPGVPVGGNGNFLSAILVIEPGVHTFNVVSHLIPLAGEPDPYGGGKVPVTYTGSSVAAVSVAGQFFNEIAPPTDLKAAVIRTDSITPEWNTVVPALTPGPDQLAVDHYSVTYGITGQPPIATIPVTPIVGNKQHLVLPYNLQPLTEYTITVTTVGPGLSGSTSINVTTT